MTSEAEHREITNRYDGLSLKNSSSGKKSDGNSNYSESSAPPPATTPHSLHIKAQPSPDQLAQIEAIKKRLEEENNKLLVRMMRMG